MTKGERIRAIREQLHMTTSAFGSKLGIQRSAVSKIENGRVHVTEQISLLICRTFNVNPAYLRDGTEPMFLHLSRDEKIASFVGDILKNDPHGFRARLIGALAQLDENDWKSLQKLANNMIDGEGQEEQPGEDQ